MTDRDLTTIVETVTRATWDRQQTELGRDKAWDGLSDLHKHQAREFITPIVTATLAAIDGYGHTIDEATTRRVVDLLDNLDVTDPEAAHDFVDELLLDLVPDPVSEAVERVVRRADWWATA